MSKKSILIFSDWYLPGYKAGGPIKSVSSMVHLLKNEFDFYIVTRDTDFGETTPYAGINSNQWIELESNGKVMYLSRNNLTFKTILNLLKENKIDLVYCNSLFSFFFSIIPVFLLRLGKIKTPVLLAPRGMLGDGALKIKAFKKMIFLSVIRFFNIHKLIHWHSTSNQETNEIIEKFGKKLKITTVGNLQVIDEYAKIITIDKKKDDVRFLFLSRISEKKNLLYALNCLNSIDTKGKSVNFEIVGPIEDAAYWAKCELLVPSLKQKGVQVNYKKAVTSDEVKSIIEKHHFLFLPTLNENFGHVIVESFFVARPVIISDQTPWRELKNHNAGWDIALNDKSLFIETLNKCIVMENEVFQQMCDSSYKFAKEKCKFDEDKEKTIKMFYSAIENNE